MKQPYVLILTLVSNLVLAATFLASRSSTSPAIAPVTEAIRREASPAPLQAPVAAGPAPSAPVSPFPWRTIESEDYRQYMANLRGIGCPERLIRDIIVADLNDLYQQKSRIISTNVAPWLNGDQRRREESNRATNLLALQNEKRALIKELLGFEWYGTGNDVWDEDLGTSLRMGFLLEDKASQVLLIRQAYSELAGRVRDEAKDILIDEDIAKLESLYAGMVGEFSRLLSPTELDELQLRDQAIAMVTGDDVHLEGVTISGTELRELVRLYKNYKDVGREEFVGHEELSESEQLAKKEAFEKQIERFLGPTRFADYQRSQDFKFREAFQFTQRVSLPGTTALKLYEMQRRTEAQVEALQSDTTLSPNEKAAALAVLKSTATQSLTPLLGNSYNEYMEGPGQWVDQLVPPPEEAP